MRAYSESKQLEVATPAHVVFAFDTLVSHLSNNGTAPTPTFHDATTALFVTWNVSPRPGSSQRRLRGCIGILEPRRLHTALRDYALTSALNDRRFAPVAPREVPSLECTVSLLSCFEEAAAWDDWEVGTHGLVIEFTDPETHVRRNATFLPEIAAEHAWSKEDTMRQLVHKAGYDGKADASLLGCLRVTRYQSSKCTLTYAQYAACRDEVGEGAPPPLATAVVQA